MIDDHNDWSSWPSATNHLNHQLPVVLTIGYLSSRSSVIDHLDCRLSIILTTNNIDCWFMSEMHEFRCDYHVKMSYGTISLQLFVIIYPILISLWHTNFVTQIRIKYLTESYTKHYFSNKSGSNSGSTLNNFPP